MLEKFPIQLCDFISLHLLYWIICKEASDTFILLRLWCFVFVVLCLFEVESLCNCVDWADLEPASASPVLDLKACMHLSVY